MADTPFIWEWRRDQGVAKWSKDLVSLGENVFDYTEGRYSGSIGAVDKQNRLFITKTSLPAKLWRVDPDMSFHQLAASPNGRAWACVRLDKDGNPWVTGYESANRVTLIQGFDADTGASLGVYPLTEFITTTTLATDREGFAYLGGVLYDSPEEYGKFFKIRLSDGAEMGSFTFGWKETIKDMKADRGVGADGSLYVQTWNYYDASFRKVYRLRRTDLAQLAVFNYPVDMIPEGLDIDSDGEVFTWNIGRFPENDRLYKLTATLVPVKYVTPRTDEQFHGGVSLLYDGHVVANMTQDNRWFYKYNNALDEPAAAYVQLVSVYQNMFSSFTSFHQSEHVQPIPVIPLDLGTTTVADILAAVAAGDPEVGLDLAVDTGAGALAKFDAVRPGVIDSANDTTAEALAKMAAFYGG